MDGFKSITDLDDSSREVTDIAGLLRQRIAELGVANKGSLAAEVFLRHLVYWNHDGCYVVRVVGNEEGVLLAAVKFDAWIFITERPVFPLKLMFTVALA